MGLFKTAIRSFGSSLGLSLFAACFVLQPVSTSADVIDLDLSGVDEEFRAVFRAAEAKWEDRIQTFSDRLPADLLARLDKLTITAVTDAIDGPGGVLGFAGPDKTLQATNPMGRTYVLPTESGMTFDTDDLADFVTNGIFEDVIFHEMGHAMGFGSLWGPSELLLNIDGGTHYVGPFGVLAFRDDISSEDEQYVPTEQMGGGGTALAHWDNSDPFFNQTFTPAFTKEILTGFAGDLDPDSGDVVYATKFISEATWGAMADLGWEVDGINGNTPDLTPRVDNPITFPKITGSIIFPFAPQGLGEPVPMPEAIKGSYTIELKKIKVRIATKKFQKITGNGGPVAATNQDPYGLRNQAWVK